MTFPLPYSGFEYLNETQIQEFTVLYKNLDGFDLDSVYNDQVGYVFEVDLLYPEHLHDLHIDLPLAPEHLNNKLVPHLGTIKIMLGPRKKYKVHYMTLKYYLHKGLVLEKIHSGIKFNQKPCMI